MKLQDTFDVPEEVARGRHSPPFAQFLHNWFGDTDALTHGDLDLTFLNDLTPEELELARDLIRRNLKLRQTHIVEGTSALHDVGAVPILRAVLDEEPEESRRLTIAGALWKLTKDPIFIDCLNRAKASSGPLLIGNHLLQVLWLGDERAVDFLIDLLDHKDRRVRTQALGLLNELELGRRMGIPAARMPRQPEDYRTRRNDTAFRDLMVGAVRKWNSEMKNGR